MIARFAFRVVACACWWGAALATVAAIDDPNPLTAVLAFGMAVLTFGAGVACWRGGDL